MRGVNKVTIVGILGIDPIIRFTAVGSPVVNLSIATTDSWKDKETGESSDKTEWHKVVLFKRLAEIAGEYLKKGTMVYIEGTLRTRQWLDANGQKRYTTEIVAREMQILNRSANSSAGANANYNMPDEYANAEADYMETTGNKNKKPAVDLHSQEDILLEEDDLPF